MSVTPRGPIAAVIGIWIATVSSCDEVKVVETTVTSSPKDAVVPDSKLTPVIFTLRLVPTVPRSGDSVPTSGTPGFWSASNARSTWIRGRVVPAAIRVSVIMTPVPTNAWRTSSTLAPGTACLRIAQAPATCGAAIEVPLDSKNTPPGYDETMLLPGANRATSE